MDYSWGLMGNDDIWVCLKMEDLPPSCKKLKGILMMSIHGALGYPWVTYLPTSFTQIHKLIRSDVSFSDLFVTPISCAYFFVASFSPLFFGCFWSHARPAATFSGHELFHLLHEEMKRAGWGPNEAQPVWKPRRASLWEARNEAANYH